MKPDDTTTEPRMSRFGVALKYIGALCVAAAWTVALQLLREQTVITWRDGPQMIGYALTATTSGVVVLALHCAGLAWVLLAMASGQLKRNAGGRQFIVLTVAYLFAWCVISVPYGVWMRHFLDRIEARHWPQVLIYAASSGDVATVKTMLDHGVEVNRVGDNGTALHAAAAMGDVVVMDVLIGAGADVNAVNAYGDSPLVVVDQAPRQKAEAIALLERHGAHRIVGTDEQRSAALKAELLRQRQARATLQE